MNKYGFVMILGLVLPAIAGNIGPTGNTCAGGTGIELIGMDGQTRFCKSEVSMNWWSAFSWCEDIAGGTLFDTTDCTYKGQNGVSQCPMVKGIISPAQTFWTANAADLAHGYRVSTDGTIVQQWTSAADYKALCKIK